MLFDQLELNFADSSGDYERFSKGVWREQVSKVNSEKCQHIYLRRIPQIDGVVDSINFTVFGLEIYASGRDNTPFVGALDKA